MRARADPPAAPDLVVVAVPPSHVVDTVAHALETWPEAVVTDVASVKSDLATRIAALPGAERYVGQPPDGRQRTFRTDGRVRSALRRPPVGHHPARWVGERSVRLVETVAELVGAVPITMDAESHDRAVALVSHVPHVLSVLAAARLADAPRVTPLAGRRRPA